MAKEKQKKQIPAEQRMYEQIITKQLYGARPTREEGIAQLQADYDAWKTRQDGIAQLQADYDNWQKEQQKAQQPVQTQPVEVQAPKVEQPKITKQTVKQHKTEVKAEEKPVEKKTYLTHADIIPSLNKANVDKQRQQLAQKKANEEASIKKIAAQLNVTEDEVKERLNPTQSKLVSPDTVKVNEEATKQVQEAINEERRKAAQKKHGVWDAFTGRMAKASKDVVNAPFAIAGKIAGKDWSLYSDAQKQELKELQEQHPVASGAGDMAGMAFAALSLGGGIGGAAGNAVNAGQVLNALKDEAILNGATKGQALAMGLKGALPVLAANAASAMPVDFATDIIPTLANDIAEGEKTDAEIVRDTLINTGINAGFDAIGDIASIAKASRNMGNPVSADDAFKANINQGYEKIKSLNAEDAAKAQTFNIGNNIVDDVNIPPRNINAGRATHIEKAYDGQVPESLGKAERIDINENAINDAMTALEEAKNSDNFATSLRKKFMSIFDSKGGQRKVIVDNAAFGGGDYVVDINKSSVNKTINNGRLSAEKLAVLEDIDSVISKGEYVGSGAYNQHHIKNKNVVRYDYFETPIRINGQEYIATFDVEVYKNANNYRTHKVVNEINLTPITDGAQGLISNTETAGAHLRIPDGIAATSTPKVDAPTQLNTAAVDSSKSLSNYDIADGVENVNKNSINNFELPKETFDKLDSYFVELAKPLNNVQNSGIMETVTDAKALKEWEAVNKAYEDLVNAAMESENIDDVIAAQKALDAARKRYARAMKNIDPSISAEFNSGSYGRNVTRPAYERKLAIDNEQNAQETFDLIRELEESNKPVEQSIDNVPRNVEGANPLQTFAEGASDDEWKIGKIRTNTLEKTGKITNPDDLPEREFAYRVFKEVEQKAAALERYAGSEDVAKDLLNLDSFDEVDVKAAMDEWQRLMDAGDTASIKKARRLALKLDGETREGGRIVQALAEYSRSTPEGQLKSAQEAIDNIVDKKTGKGTSETLDRVAEKIYKAFDNSNGDKEAFKKELDDILSGDLRKHATSKTSKSMASKSITGKNKVIKMIDKGASVDEIIDQVYKDNGGVKLTPEEQKKIYDYLTEAAKLPEGSYEQEELFSKAAKIAVGRAPSTIGQKIRSVLYNNMLGNFKTALSRNAFGNFGYQILEQARQPISAVVDRATAGITGKRSALGWNAQKAGAYASGFGKGAKEQLTDMIRHIDTGRSGAKGWELALANNATTYNDSKLIGKFANNVEYYVRNAMELGDRPFFEANYKQNYVELMQLLERYGKENVAGLEGIKDADLPEVVDMIASVRAADSVFQKHGKMSKGLTDLRNGLGEMSEGVIGADVLSTAASPFTMTPGNMLERAIEYTPLGFAKNAIETIKEVGGKKGFNQRRFVDEASRSIAGLPLLYGTYKMAENGMINGGYSTDPDEKAAQQEDGFIEYGFNVPENVPIYGGKTFDTSDIPVIGPDMQAGSVIAEEGLTPKAGLQAAEAVLGSSTLQGLRRAFGAESSSFGYSSQDTILDNLLNTVKSSGSQFIPSLARQTAQTIDPYKRDLGEYGTNEYYLNLMKNSDPIGRQTLPVKTNVEGEPVLQNQGRSLPQKILENYVFPMNVSEYNPSPLNQEASRLLKSTGENAGFTPKAKRSDLKQWDEANKIDYTEEQFRSYKKDLGQLNASMGNALTNSNEYKQLTDAEKVKALGDAYTAMKQVARYNATGSMGDNSLAKIYREAGGGDKGIQAVIKEASVKAAYKRYDVTDSNGAREVYENYGDSGLQVYSEIKKKLNNSQKSSDIASAVNSIPGLSKKEKAKYYSYVDTDAKPNQNPFGYIPGINYDPQKDDTYKKAKSYMPSLSPIKFYETKDSIDADSNGNIKEAEMLDYINFNARDEEEANAMWNAYHGESKNKKGQIKKVVKKGNEYIATY